MKRALAITAGLLAVLWTAGALVQQFTEDPEPHTTAQEPDPAPEPDSPPIISDPTMATVQPFRTMEVARSADGTALPNAPYPLLFKDGR